MSVDYVKEVKEWIEKFVIGLDLCPFAKKPFNADKVNYKLAENWGRAELLLILERQLDKLQTGSHSTTIIIIPTKAFEFRSYLNLFSECEAMLIDLGLEEEFQLASFHPDYQFAETDFADQSNYTNRSPYPLIHILRASAVELAIASYGETAAIYKRNIDLLRSLTSQELQSYYPKQLS